MYRKYLSLVFLFFPACMFLLFLLSFHKEIKEVYHLTSTPIPLYLIMAFGIIATIGGVLDWSYHRNVLKLKISKKERKSELLALACGGAPMFVLMCCATLSQAKSLYLIPIMLILIYTVVMICYDEFVYHLKRCKLKETIYHRMLVFGNGIAWFSWFYFIYVS